jgi:hypothetical protein
MWASDTEDLETLKQRATSLAAEAAMLSESYRRATWIRFTLVFFPVPFVVVLLRLQLESWHYYLAGAAYLGFSAILYSMDSRASDKCDQAVRAAGRARQAYELASHPSQRRASPLAPLLDL